MPLPINPSSVISDCLAGLQTQALARGAHLSLGVDLVEVARIEESLRRFGQAFTNRLFTPAEVAYAQAAPGQCAERLAARFAAKEATLKAVGLADAGVGWRDMEVYRAASGACEMRLHGKAAELAHQAGMSELVLSLSHDGGWAVAIVGAVRFPKTEADSHLQAG